MRKVIFLASIVLLLQQGHAQQPLASFVAPFVGDTITTLSFTVNVNIIETTGAPVSTPQLSIHTTVNGSYHLSSSVIMTKSGSVWVAQIPKQYYGSKVVYSLTVSDNGGNTTTIKDSTYIKFQTSGGFPPSSSGVSNILTGFQPANNGWGGVAFDLVAGSQPVMITAFDTEFENTGTSTVQMHYRIGSVCGRVSSNAGWTRIGQQVVTVGNNYSAHVPLTTPVIIPAGQTYGFYFHATSGMRIGYITGGGACNTTTVAANSDMTLKGGHGIANSNSLFPAAGSVYTERNFAGTIYYDVASGDIGVGEVSVGNNLAILSIIEPVNTLTELCTPNYSPIKIALTNLGENDYDFSKDTITLGYKVTDPKGGIHIGSLSRHSGGMISRKTDIIELTSALPTPHAGIYTIKAWVTSPIDTIVYDDTIVSTYFARKIELPLDDDFSQPSLSSDFVSQSLFGNTKWDQYQPNASFAVQPDFGTGILRYESAGRTVAKISTRQLELYGASNPKMEFWYYHDTNSVDGTYTDVYVVADNIDHRVLSLTKKGNATHGWTHYTVNLSPYTNAQCVVIEFESGSSQPSEQYIDRIWIYAYQNLALDTILISPFGLCDFKNKEVRVIMRNTYGQRMDYSSYNAGINLEIKRGATLHTDAILPLSKGVIEPYSQDTVTFIGIHLDTGIYQMRAWITVPLDADPSDDTVRRTLSINPDIAITTTSNTNIATYTDCLAPNMKVKQEVTVTNKGNLDVFDIPLVLEVWSGNVNVQALPDTLKGILPAGASRNWTFAQSYTVPKEEIYNIVVMAELDCDADKTNNDTIIMECVDMDDIALIELLNPALGQVDNAGASVYLEVSMENSSFSVTFPTVRVHAVISDGFNPAKTITETITNFAPSMGTPTNIRFSSPYTVPFTSNYTITVFVDKVDNNQQNDTLKAEFPINMGDDIALIAWMNPPVGAISNVGEAVHLEVTMRNNSTSTTFDAVVVNARIKSAGNSDIVLRETLANFKAEEYRSYRFSSPYTVPAASNYTIKVFFDSVDDYPWNDTLETSFQTNSISSYSHSGFSLGQNIPNPAKETTRIEYNIPSDGQVIFTVYSITGQILHTEKQDAQSGENKIAFSTANLAGGIYYYSMEYKGERLVRRMSVRK